MRLRVFAAFVILSSVAVGACLDDSITGTRPLTMEMSVEPESVAVDETVQAAYTATGTGLIGIVLEWGDGTADSVDLRGAAVTAAGTIEHEYTDTGTYTVRGTAEAQNGILTSSATVLVN